MTASGLAAEISPALDRLARVVERSPGRAFATFTFLHLVLWTAVPTILCSNPPLDVIEGVAFGRDWQLGYWKHPPLPWLLVDLTHQLFGGRPWAYFLLGQVAVGVCFWAVWRLGREILSSIEAFAAVVMLDGCFVFTMATMEFNHNIMQLPLFALAGWSLYRAFIGGRLLDWLLVGLWFALAFYTKYEAVVLLMPALLFAIVDPQARRCWKTLGPYIAALTCAALFAPHAIWALNHHFTAIEFFNDRAPAVFSPPLLFRDTAVFGGHGILLIVPVVILLCVVGGPFFWRAPEAATASDQFARRYLTFLAWGPLIFSLMVQLALGRHFVSGWATQFWCFVSLHLLATSRPAIDRTAVRRLFFAWVAVTVVWIVIQIATQVFLIATTPMVKTQFPGAQFAALVSQAWRKEVDEPLAYVAGGFWEAGNVILYSTDSPRLFEAAAPSHTPRVDPADIRCRGAVILLPARVGRNVVPPPADNPAWMAQFPGAEPREPFVIRRMTPRGEIVWTIGWALLRPQAPRLAGHPPLPVRDSEPSNCYGARAQ